MAARDADKTKQQDDDALVHGGLFQEAEIPDPNDAKQKHNK